MPIFHLTKSPALFNGVVRFYDTDGETANCFVAADSLTFLTAHEGCLLLLYANVSVFATSEDIPFGNNNVFSDRI